MYHIVTVGWTWGIRSQRIERTEGISSKINIHVYMKIEFAVYRVDLVPEVMMEPLGLGEGEVAEEDMVLMDWMATLDIMYVHI